MTRFLRSSNCPNQHYKGRERWGLILPIQHIFTMDRLNTKKFRETALKIHWLMTILAEASRYIISCGHDFSWSKNKATSRRSAENTQYLHCSCATIMQGVGTVYNSNNYWIVTQLSLIWRTRSISLRVNSNKLVFLWSKLIIYFECLHPFFHFHHFFLLNLIDVTQYVLSVIPTLLSPTAKLQISPLTEID